MGEPAKRLEPAADVSTEASVTDAAKSMMNAARGVVAEFADLVALESRLAVRSLLLAVVLGLSAALLVLTGWGLLVAAGVEFMTRTGLSLAAALLISAGASVLVAALLAAFVPAMLRRLTFRSTRRILREPQQKPERHGP